MKQKTKTHHVIEEQKIVITFQKKSDALEKCDIMLGMEPVMPDGGPQNAVQTTAGLMFNRLKEYLSEIEKKANELEINRN